MREPHWIREVVKYTLYRSRDFSTKSNRLHVCVCVDMCARACVDVCVWTHMNVWKKYFVIGMPCTLIHSNMP